MIQEAQMTDSVIVQTLIAMLKERLIVNGWQVGFSNTIADYWRRDKAKFRFHSKEQREKALEIISQNRR